MRKRLLSAVLFCLAFLAAGSLWAQPTVRAAINTPIAFIGSPVHLLLQVNDVPAGTSFTWPRIPETIGGLEIVARGNTDTIKTGANLRLEQQITLLGFDSGLFTIPPQNFKISGRELATGPVTVYYTPLPVDTAAPIRPIRDIIAAPPVTINWLFWIAVGAGALLLVLLFFWLWKKYRKSRPLYKQRPVVNTADALRALGAANLATRPFYTQLSQLLRDALSQKWEVPTRRQTTAQTLAQGKSRLDTETLNLLEGLLTEGDTVKFAKAEKSVSDAQAALSRALKLVQKAELP